MQCIWKVLVLLLITTLSIRPTAAEEAHDEKPPPFVTERAVYTFVVEADGSSREISSVTERITSEVGATEYGESYFNFSTSRSTFSVHEAYTLTPGNERIDVLPNAIRYLDEADNSSATMFTDSKDVVVVFPNTSIGSRLFTLTEKVNHTPSYPGHYTKALGSNHRYITEHAEYRFFIHPDLKFKHQAHGVTPITYQPLTDKIPLLQRQAEKEANKNGYQFLGFQYQNLRERQRETDEADLGIDGSLVLISSIKDHGELARQYRMRADPMAEITPEIKDKANTITLGLETPREKAKAIYHWVNQNIRYVAIYLADGGLVPHEASAVLRNRYGDCKDHVVLLQAMLAAVGIKSEPVFVNAGNRYHLPSVALTYPFNHVISYLPDLDIYLDPTAQFAPFGVLPFWISDKPVVHGHSGISSRTPKYSPDSNLTKTTMHLTLDSRGFITGRVLAEVKGNNEMQSRSLAFDRLGSNQEKHISSWLSSNREIGTGKITSPNPREMSVPFNSKTEFQLEDHVDLKESGAFTIPIGISPATLMRRTIYKPEVNRTKSFTCEPELIEENITFNLGNTLSITRIPIDTHYSSKLLSYQSTYTLTSDKGFKTLKISRRLRISPRIHVCPVDSQKDFEEVFYLMRRDLRQLVFYGQAL
jgi:transglutaminase-like putative cysteine protease